MEGPAGPNWVRYSFEVRSARTRKGLTAIAMKADMYQRALPALIALAFVLSTVPAFFAIYRDAAFQTLPRDDYAPHLLALVGERGTPPARQPTLLGGNPMGYRMLSVAAAIPFYELLPLLPVL